MPTQEESKSRADALRAKALREKAGSTSLFQAPLQKPIDPRVAGVAEGALGFPSGSQERSKEMTVAKSLADVTGANTPKDLPSDELEKVLQIQKVQDRLKDLIKFKSSGFGGEGINTGPLIGGKASDLVPFWDSGPKVVPDWLSQYISESPKLGGREDKAGSADRGLLRQKIVSILGPKQKEQTGAAAALRELLELIYPQLPLESDTDKLFFEKAFEGLTRGQEDLRNRISGYRSSNLDVSGLRRMEEKTPDQVIDEVTKSLAGQGGKYSLQAVDPSRIKKILGGSQGSKVITDF